MAELVVRIGNGDRAAETELWSLVERPLRYLIARILESSDHVEDALHDTATEAMLHLRRRDLRCPEAVAGYLATIARRRAGNLIKERISERAQRNVEDMAALEIPSPVPDPEKQLLLKERCEIATRVLRKMSLRDQEVLRRFYLEEQPKEQIMAEMQLNETSFRLLKSRAKRKLTEAMDRRKKTSWLQTLISG